MTCEAHIVDVEFAHADGISATYKLGPIRWRRDCDGRVPVRFFTDRSLEKVHDFESDAKVALLIEPRIGGNVRYYEAAARLPFDWVLSYDRGYVASIGARGLTYQFGGAWVESYEAWTDEPKTSLVSLITSPKCDSTGQRLRHEVAAEFPMVVRYGSDFRYVESKATALLPFAFSVVIENSRIDDYFSEKLIDCMLCGTVPIYWGSPNIGLTFDADGVISFSGIDELRGILEALTMDEWARRRPAVQDNMVTAMRFLSPEFQLAKRYPFLFAEAAP